MNSTTLAAAGSHGVTTGPRLLVQADLTIEVNGVTAHLTSEGSGLVLTSQHPEALWASVLDVAPTGGVGRLDGPRAVGRLADSLVDSGLRLKVTGPRGTVVSLGAGVRSRIGQLVTGSSAVGPEATAALASLVWHQAQKLLLRMAVTLGAATTAVIHVRRRTQQ